MPVCGKGTDNIMVSSREKLYFPVFVEMLVFQNLNHFKLQLIENPAGVIKQEKKIAYFCLFNKAIC